jgi:hypothetical protein
MFEAISGRKGGTGRSHALKPRWRDRPECTARSGVHAITAVEQRRHQLRTWTTENEDVCR